MSYCKGKHRFPVKGFKKIIIAFKSYKRHHYWCLFYYFLQLKIKLITTKSLEFIFWYVKILMHKYTKREKLWRKRKVI